MEIIVEKVYPFYVEYQNVNLLSYFDINLGGNLRLRSVKLFQNKHNKTYFLGFSCEKKDLIEITNKEFYNKLIAFLIRAYKEKVDESIF